ncbi:hypothetical protein EC973_009163 [Apophysomyces ossiformis]|uniref:Glycosyltransferase family 49 protein n=1 Tax=Apophysomyces ossiformis TaxID=679940 RepID=A0A8H7BK22_9FUNG|nr:hypothetical protein EC973_009163 [Apophysomyces ossiformis]
MRFDFKQGWPKFVKYLVLAYACVSLLYTVGYFYTSHAFTTAIGHSEAILPRAENGTQKHNVNEMKVALEDEPEPHSIVWSSDEGITQSMPETFVMSKIFSDAMGPSNLTPYFFKARKPVEKEDLTMATLVTHDRFEVLSRLASHYRGPISAAIHVNDDETKDKVMRSLREIYGSNPDMHDYVDVHLILDRFDRQFNLWRNVAKFFARTDYLMMLDVDFHLCTNFRESIRRPEIMEKLRSGRTALVVPAFEYVIQDDGKDWKKFPTTKKDLMARVEEGQLDMFHRSWVKGHGSTDYDRWYKSAEMYEVTEYDFSYEPYIIYKKEGSPWCDERFIGYGGNKAACLYEIYLSGIDYWVLPNDFLIHQTHQYPEDTRRKERQYNRRLYSNFREEVCLRYARLFVASGEWETDRAENLKQECQKIRGFRSSMNALLNQ